MLNSRQNSLSVFFSNVNSKFDNYACSSSIFKSAGLYIVLTTVYLFVSANFLASSLPTRYINHPILYYQQILNVYRLIYMMMERDQVITQNPENNLYKLTNLVMFVKIPWLNFNVYDITLAVQYAEILRLYWLFRNIMQVELTGYRIESKNSKNLYPFFLFFARIIIQP